MRIPILTYHASNISGNTYATNDARALESDLQLLTDRGFSIWPLHQVLTAWLDRSPQLEDGRIACLTCDDGTDFDFRDIEHPTCGPQRSVHGVLADFGATHAREQPSLNITAFVIVSPEARAHLDTTCLAGGGWYNDDWWRAAVDSGRMDVANHSWDHNHETIAQTPHPGVRRGTFRSIVTRELADFQIRQAGDYLRSIAPNRGAQLFAYPYGDANAYLVSDYFPKHAAELDIIAAFTTRSDFLSESTNRWAVPRFTCGHDWSSPQELDRILRRVDSPDWLPRLRRLGRTFHRA
jgi:peptidoglycan/xylan/chitin deacetylase (PgdA/CDA1 family)